MARPMTGLAPALALLLAFAPVPAANAQETLQQRVEARLRERDPAPASGSSSRPRTAGRSSRSLRRAFIPPRTPRCSPPRRLRHALGPRPADTAGGAAVRLEPASGAGGRGPRGHGDARLPAPPIAPSTASHAGRRRRRATRLSARDRRRKFSRPALEPGDELEQYRTRSGTAASALSSRQRLPRASRPPRPAAAALESALLRDRQSPGPARRATTSPSTASRAATVALLTGTIAIGAEPSCCASHRRSRI